MNKTNYFIECLELMGWCEIGRDTYSKNFRRSWLALEPGCTNYNQTRIANNDEELINFTIQELIERDGVMERVRGVTGNCTHRYVGQDNDVIEEDYTPEELIQYAIELVTPKELMGVEG